MKITVDGKQYIVKTRKIETDANYDREISIFRAGEKAPICGTIYRKTNYVKKIQIATQLIKSYEKYVCSDSL